MLAIITSTLLDELAGVIEAVTPVAAVNVVDDELVLDVVVADITCRTAPAPKFDLAAPLASIAAVTVALSADVMMLPVLAGSVSVSFVDVPVVAANVIEPEPEDGFMFKGITLLPL